MKTLDLKQFIIRSLAGLVLTGGGFAVRADYASEMMAQQPLTYWRFNDTGNFVFPDNVATNLGTAGATNGAYSFQAATKGFPGALSGSADTCAAFTNVTGDINFIGNYIDVPNDAILNPSGPFTVEFWVKSSGVTSSDATGLSPLFNANYNGSSDRSGWVFYETGAKTWNFRVGNSSGYIANISGGTATTNWQHVAGVYDGTSITLYVDGVLVAGPTSAAGFSPNSGQPIRVGGSTVPNRGFDGLVDEIVLYTKQLQAADIAAHYSAAATNGPGYAAQILALQPALYLRLDEPIITNPPAINLGSLSAAGNGTYLSSLVPGPSGLVPPTFPGLETTNRDLVFNGVSSEVFFNLPNVPAPWTAVFWVNRQDALGVSAVLLTSPATGLKLEQYGTDRLVGFTAYGVADYNFNYSVPASTWTHLAFVGTPTGTLLYTNGFLADSNAASISLPLTRLGGPGDPPNVELDEVATFNRALLEGQIRTLYLTAAGDANPPGFVNDVPIVSPSGTIYGTTPFTLSIDAFGAGPLSFQWRKEGTVVGTGRDYSQTNATVADNGNYDVIVSNGHGAITSAVVTITVNPAVPPTVAQPPLARIAYAGGNALFSVGAAGTAPFSYQWKKAGAEILGATNQTLLLTNVTAADATTYSVGVTNVAGGIVSPGAVLTLRVPPANTYEAAVVGSVPLAYYRFGEASGTNAVDSIGAHDGVYDNVTLGLPGYSTTDPNTAAGFDPTQPSDMRASLPQFLYTGATPAFSLEAWVNFNDLTGIQRVFSKGGPGNSGIGFGINTASGLRFTTYGVQDFDLALATPLTANTWYHLVGVANGGAFYFYLDGALAGSITFTGAGNSSSPPFMVGKNGLGVPEGVNGTIDEVAIYTRALTADEISSHYAVVKYGTTTPPFLVSQPAPTSEAVGSTISLSVQAAGSVPLSYQWNKDSAPIPGATTSSLTFSNLYYTDAGAYSVTITNAAGLTNSATAAITVLPPPTFANLTNGLVLHLKLDQNFSDSSGRANDASANGSPAFVSGELGQAVELKTVTGGSPIYNYLTVADPNGDLSFSETDSLSIATWLKYTGAFNDLPILGNAINSTYQKGLVLSEDGGKFEWTAVGVDTGSIIADPAGGPLINNSIWHHVALVLDRSTALANTYVDGVRINTRSISGLGTLVTGNVMTLGQDPTGVYNVGGTFDLDDLGIWRRTLSDYEVLSIYNAAVQSGQSFDVFGPVKLFVGNSSSGVVVAWQTGTLESADELKSDPAQTVWTSVAGAAAPTYFVTPGAAKKFYRVHL